MYNCYNCHYIVKAFSTEYSKPCYFLTNFPYDTIELLKKQGWVWCDYRYITVPDNHLFAVLKRCKLGGYAQNKYCRLIYNLQVKGV